MEHFRQPGPLVLHGNVAENWRRWKQQFSIYMTATGKTSSDDEVKCAIFLHLAGPDALEVIQYTNLCSSGRRQETRQSHGQVRRLLQTTQKHHVGATHIQLSKPKARRNH